MAQNYYESFKKKLEEIFMMDHAELDFGIYRIMNQKRNDIQRFLDSELLPQVKQVLEDNNGGETDKAKKRMAEIAASVGGNVEVLPKGTPMRDEYDKLGETDKQLYLMKLTKKYNELLHRYNKEQKENMVRYQLN